MKHTRNGRLAAVRRIALTSAALVGALALSGCFHVSKRALANGRALSANGTSGTLLYRERGLQSMRTLYSRADPYRARFREVPYPYFGQW